MSTLYPGTMVDSDSAAEAVRLHGQAQAWGWTPVYLGDGVVRWDMPGEPTPLLLAHDDLAGLRNALGANITKQITGFMDRYGATPQAHDTTHDP